MTIKFKRNGIIQADKFVGPNGDDLRLWHKLDSYTIGSAVASLAVEFERNESWEDYKVIKIAFQGVTFTSTVNLNWFESVNDAVSYASSHRNHIMRTNSGAAAMVDNWSATRAAIEAQTAISNGSNSQAHGYIIVYNWQHTSSDHYFLCETSNSQGAGEHAGGAYSWSGYNPNGRTTHIKMQPASGNIDAGTFTVWGCKYGQ